jgi:riboflavin-specific deaminase-like protein
VRQLLPEPVDGVEPDELYPADERPTPPGRPWLLLNMVASVDGAITVDGRSGGLGGTADRAAFAALRSVADVILVGAGTVRAERYGPPRPTEAHRRAREARGQAPVPRLAIVTARLDLDLDTELFTASPTRPIVVTSSGGTTRVRDVSDVARVADVIETPGDAVDLTTALARLRSIGVATVLCEGGPTLNAELLAAGLVDELCVTIAPLLVGGDSARMLGAHRAESPTGMRLARLVEDEGVLLARYLLV